MTVKADTKKRVIVPGAKPGDVFNYQEQENGHFLLVRLNQPEPPKRMTRQQVRSAMKACKLKPTMTWEQLRAWTREP